MARQIYKQHLEIEDNFQLVHDGFQKWAINETLRRTYFLVHIINVLSYHKGPQNSFYFEPLDDETTLNLAIPSSEAIWRATSAVEWAARIKDHSSERKYTVQDVIKRLENIDVGTGEGQNIVERLSMLDDLTKLAIACSAKGNTTL